MYSIDETRTSSNNMDDMGIKFLELIDEVDYMIEVGKYTVAEIETYMESELNKFSVVKLDEDVQYTITEMILESFLNTIETGDKIAIAKAYEDFVSDNITDEQVKEICLYNIAFHKWISYRYYNEDIEQNKFEPCAFRPCFDCCMLRTYESYNLINWIYFYANPPEDVLRNAGACAWNCI